MKEEDLDFIDESILRLVARYESEVGGPLRSRLRRVLFQTSRRLRVRAQLRLVLSGKEYDQQNVLDNLIVARAERTSHCPAYSANTNSFIVSKIRAVEFFIPNPEKDSDAVRHARARLAGEVPSRVDTPNVLPGGDVRASAAPKTPKGKGKQRAAVVLPESDWQDRDPEEAEMASVEAEAKEEEVDELEAESEEEDTAPPAKRRRVEQDRAPSDEEEEEGGQAVKTPATRRSTRKTAGKSSKPKTSAPAKKAAATGNRQDIRVRISGPCDPCQKAGRKCTRKTDSQLGCDACSASAAVCSYDGLNFHALIKGALWLNRFAGSC